MLGLQASSGEWLRDNLELGLILQEVSWEVQDRLKSGNPMAF